jgi:ankyrin repeat protein
MPGTFSDLSAAQSVDTARHIDFTFHQSLFDAISSGSEEEVTNLLSTGAPVNIRDSTDNSPLHVAIMKGNFPIVRSLLNYGANIDAAGFKKRTPLHLAVGSQALVELLLKHQPTLSLQDDDGNTPLHHLLNTDDWTEKHGVRTTILLFLSAGMDINIINRLGESSLHRIVNDVSSLSSFNLNYWQRVEMMSEFLNHKPNVTSTMRNGKTLLAVFLEKSHIFSRNYYYPGLEKKGFVCLEQFLIAGADPNTIVNSKPLLVGLLSKVVFVKGGESEKALVQLIQRADINVAGLDGNYPLHLSLARWEPKMRWEFGNYAITAALISRNADVNQTNNAGASPLEIWLDVNRHRLSVDVVDVALLLVEAGADTTKASSTEKTLFDMPTKMLMDDRTRLTKAFLKADMEKFQQEDYNVHTRLGWVEVWRSACKQSPWHLAKAKLSELEYTPSRPRTVEFMECASLVIMEHLLERHQSRLKLWLSGELDKDSVTENYEEYCAILKDCRGRKPDIDVSWYTFLLDVMDFK